MRKLIQKKLGELLVEGKWITPENLEAALKVQNEKGGLLGQILVQLGFTTEEAIAQALTAQYGFPYLPLGGYQIDAEVVKTIPVHVAKQYAVMAVDRVGNVLTVAMSNPLNQEAIEDLELMTRLKIQVFVSTMSDIARTIERYYKAA
jgi:type IV pilus assembly protein PilB